MLIFSFPSLFPSSLCSSSESFVTGACLRGPLHSFRWTDIRQRAFAARMTSLLDHARFFWPMWVWIGVFLLGSGSLVVNAQVQATCLQGYQYVSWPSISPFHPSLSLMSRLVRQRGDPIALPSLSNPYECMPRWECLCVSLYDVLEVHY